VVVVKRKTRYGWTYIVFANKYREAKKWVTEENLSNRDDVWVDIVSAYDEAGNAVRSPWGDLLQEVVNNNVGIGTLKKIALLFRYGFDT
jgi:hypothetical protein